MSCLPDVIDNALKVFIVDGDVIDINSRNVEAANRQQTPTISYLQQHEMQHESGTVIQHETVDSVSILQVLNRPPHVTAA